MSFSAYSTKGIRSKNEDAYLIIECINGKALIQYLEHGVKSEFDFEYPGLDFHLYAISDGMGGLQNGDEASYLVITGLLDSIESVVQSDDIGASIREMIVRTSRRVYSNLSGAGGATLVGVLLIKDKLYVFNSGDSTCAVLNNDEVWMTKPQRNENGLTDRIGKNIDPCPDIDVLHGFDSIILHTDGADILGDIYDKGSPDYDARALCERSVKLGSKDNVSIVIIKKEREHRI